MEKTTTEKSKSIGITEETHKFLNDRREKLVEFYGKYISFEEFLKLLNTLVSNKRLIRKVEQMKKLDWKKERQIYGVKKTE